MILNFPETNYAIRSPCENDNNIFTLVIKNELH